MALVRSYRGVDGAIVQATGAGADDAAIVQVVLLDQFGAPLSLGGSGASAQQVQGTVASGAPDSGNPLTVAGVVSTTAPNATNGQRVTLQMAAAGVPILGFRSTPADGLANSYTSLYNSIQGSSQSTGALAVFGAKFNGTTWDRDRKPNATKILPSAAANTNPDFAKASAGDLWCVSGFNAALTVRYLKMFNKASAPTVGTDTPVMVIALPVGAFNIPLFGHYFGTGIAFALTTGPALADTGALTAADIVGLTLTFA